MAANIFITGFSGSGLSTAARDAARLLGWSLVDMDEMIAAEAGVSIEEIFARRGEEEFRRIERETLARVALSERQVVSTGGGVPVDERNREVMAASGVVALLEASVETLLARLAQQRADEGDDLVARPMLDADDLAARIRSLKAERQFAYTQADLTVQTDCLTPAQAAERIAREAGALGFSSD